MCWSASDSPPVRRTRFAFAQWFCRSCTSGYCGVRSQPRIERTSISSQLRSPASPYDNSAADVFAHIRHLLASQGTLIGPYDLQIAAIALGNGCTLVTHNTSEFCRVPSLVLEDWEVT